MPAVKPIPDGYPAVIPYLIVNGAAAAISFYKTAFGAVERLRLGAPDGRIGHAELAIGDSVVMLADEHPEIGAVGPRTVGGTPVGLHVYIADVDAAVAREGWKIVLLTRLSPAFPFNLLNYAFGLTRVALRDYVLASWIGMMPGTVMYVYLGSVAGDLATLGAGAQRESAALHIRRAAAAEARHGEGRRRVSPLRPVR